MIYCVQKYKNIKEYESKIVSKARKFNNINDACKFARDLKGYYIATLSDTNSILYVFRWNYTNKSVGVFNIVNSVKKLKAMTYMKDTFISLSTIGISSDSIFELYEGKDKKDYISFKDYNGNNVVLELNELISVKPYLGDFFRKMISACENIYPVINRIVYSNIGSDLGYYLNEKGEAIIVKGYLL